MVQESIRRHAMKAAIQELQAARNYVLCFAQPQLHRSITIISSSRHQCTKFSSARQNASPPGQNHVPIRWFSMNTDASSTPSLRICCNRWDQDPGESDQHGAAPQRLPFHAALPLRLACGWPLPAGQANPGEILSAPATFSNVK